MDMSKVSLGAALSALVLFNISPILAADPAPADDARIQKLEEKIKALERRLNDLENQRVERAAPTPPPNNRFPGMDPRFNEMIEQLQKEMMGNGFDFNNPNFGGGRGMRPQNPDRKPRLGVALDKVTDELKKEFKNDVKEGAFVVNVVPNSAADKAGIKEGDAITSFDGKAVDSPETLIDAVRAAAKGSKDIIVTRHGQQMAMKVELGTEVEEGGAGLNLRLDPEQLPQENANVQTQTEVKVGALELSSDLAKDLNLTNDQKTKAQDILSKHQKALTAEIEKGGGMQKRVRNGAISLNMTNNFSGLARKHADDAEKELADVFNPEQLKKWNDYRKTHESVSISQSVRTENFIGAQNNKGGFKKMKEEDDAKF